MSYDQLLAGRVRHALEGRTDVVEKAMFGGLTFMVSGNMCCGVNRDDLIIRLAARTTTEELNSPHARLWDFMPSRPMPGIFAIRAQGSARTTGGSTVGSKEGQGAARRAGRPEQADALLQLL